jgi:hypothetical protein
MGVELGFDMGPGLSGLDQRDGNCRPSQGETVIVTWRSTGASGEVDMLCSHLDTMHPTSKDRSV